MYQETLQFYHLWRLAVQERDEAREQLMHSLAELSQFREIFDTLLLSEVQIPSHHPEVTDETTGYQKCNYNDSPSWFSSASPLDFFSSVNSSPLDPSFRSSQMNFVVGDMKDYETVVLEMIGGVLPENGKFLQAVSEAGLLVESLFIAGPVPKWKTPPVQMSSQIPVFSNNNITGNWNYGCMEFGSGIQNRSFPGMSHFSFNV